MLSSRPCSVHLEWNKSSSHFVYFFSKTCREQLDEQFARFETFASKLEVGVEKPKEIPILFEEGEREIHLRDNRNFRGTLNEPQSRSRSQLCQLVSTLFSIIVRGKCEAKRSTFSRALPRYHPATCVLGDFLSPSVRERRMKRWRAGFIASGPEENALNTQRLSNRWQRQFRFELRSFLRVSTRNLCATRSPTITLPPDGKF